MLNLVSSEVDQEVSQLLNVAEQIAHNTFVQQAVSTTDRDPATEEQSTVVHTINENIEEINSINELTTNTAQELADASAELQSLYKRLDAMVGNFKL